MLKNAVTQKYLSRYEQSNSGPICSCPRTIVFVYHTNNTTGEKECSEGPKQNKNYENEMFCNYTNAVMRSFQGLVLY